MQTEQDFNSGLLDFLGKSTTPFHAVAEMAARFSQAGFERLLEADEWQLQPVGRYYVIRNDSSIVAFNLASSNPLESGFRMVGAHTDSPCLKVKPQPEINSQGYFQLGVEVYGGALLNPWFDRDLSLAGRVSFKDQSGQLKSQLIDYQRPLAVVPSLAIHLDKEANKKRQVNPQQHLPPVLLQADAGQVDFRQLLQARLLEQHPDCQVDEVLDYELSFYDTQLPAVIGFNNQFIASARLDNLLSCYVGLQALLATGQQNCLLVCNDHEEVGSASAAGAQGPMLKSVLERITGSATNLARAIDHSMFISADNAHGVHPNYADRHDGNHGPKLNAGPVIKTNANQRYASNSETAAVFRHCCELAKAPVQSFVVRSDMGCGSTIGPITASGLGVKTIDIGVPTFAMHSIRELAGSKDAFILYTVLKEFNQLESTRIS